MQKITVCSLPILKSIPGTIQKKVLLIFLLTCSLKFKFNASFSFKQERNKLGKTELEPGKSENSTPNKKNYPGIRIKHNDMLELVHTGFQEPIIQFSEVL